MYARVLLHPDALSCAEGAPLLRGAETEENVRDSPSFSERLNAVAQEPFTPLTKILLIIALVLLLASSVSVVNLLLRAFVNLNWSDFHRSLRWCPTQTRS